MNARTSWSAKADRRSGENSRDDDSLPLDELLDARFDREGRLSQGGRGGRARLDARPPAMSAEELERAVQKLAEGLEAIERQSSAARAVQPRAEAPAARTRAAQPEAGGGEGQNFVTYSLDRLEARLEALSKRLQQRAHPQDGEPLDSPAPVAYTPGSRQPSRAAAQVADVRRSDPSLAVEPGVDLEVERAEARRQAEAETRARREAEEEVQQRRQAELETRRQAEAAETARLRREAEAQAEQRRRAEIEARREADAAEAVRAKYEAEAAETRRRIEAEAEARRRAESAAAEARRRAEEAEAERRAQSAAVGETRRQFATLESRIEAIQQSCDANQIEPLRNELLEHLRHIKELGRDGRSIAGAVEQLGGKLDMMESTLAAAGDMAGSRLGELQDRLIGLADRLGQIEVEVPGFDALRENQSAILERFDRMEGLVHQLNSSEDMLERVEVLRKQLQTIASQRDLGRVEQQIIGLADRLEALPEHLSDAAVLERMEGQLQALAVDFRDARRQRDTGSADLDRRLADLFASLQRIEDADHAPDLSGFEARISDVMSRLDGDRRLSGDSLSRLDARLAALTTAIEAQEHDASAEVLAGLTRRIDALAIAIEGHDVNGARRDIEGLDRKFDQLSRSLVSHSGDLSRTQLKPLEERLDQLQGQLQHLTDRTQASTAQLGPFAQKLQEISDRVSGIAGADRQNGTASRLAAIEERLTSLVNRGPDRALHTQLESIVSRLELLKGRSIDPARMTELFDRVEGAIRGSLVADRFDRLEQRIAESVPSEHFERIERRIADGARGGVSEERFARLEQKLDGGALQGLTDERFARLEQKLADIGRSYSGNGAGLGSDDLADLRDDIVALRRELRSLPGLGEGEGNLGGLLKTIATHLERLPEDRTATAAELESQVERLAQLLDQPGHGRLSVAHIETSLKSIEQRLEETRRAALAHSADPMAETDRQEIDSVAGLARALSDDVTVLKGSTEESDRKTKEALEAVQGTLEAVVKRMAFLERDAGKPAARSDEPGALEAPKVAVRPPVPVPQVEPVLQAGSEPPAISLDPIDRPVAQAEPPREPSGGLFSRFTSSQLLKRATGGRAESFSPDSDESEDDAADIPLEPGTDAPLTSSLSGAPSSDTAHMSGARRARIMRAGRNAESVDAPVGAAAAEPLPGDDFLAAARRAAQAASADVSEVDADGDVVPKSRMSRIFGETKTGRRLILASVLAVAVAFAAMQLIRARQDAREAALAPPVPVTAQVEELPAPSAVMPAPPADMAAMSEEPAAEVSAPAASLPPRDVSAPEAVTPPPAPVTAELRPEEAGPAFPPAPEGADATPPMTPAPADTMAAVEPAAEGEAPSPPSAAEGSASPAATTSDLPDPIGPPRLRDAALAGDPVAAFEVAARYAEGRGAAQDLTAAVAWYTRAAEQGMAPAQYRLGSIYEKGAAVPKDLPAAQKWYSEAADAGNVKAMHNLAVLYAEGAGGEPDLERAADLFRRAADHGVRDSQFNLAILHARGLGVREDMVEAYKWFAVAASSGDAESAKRRDIIAAALSKSDLEEAQTAAASFQPLPLVSEANEVLMPEGGWGDVTSEQSKSEDGSVEAKDDEVAASGGDAITPSENDRVALVQKLLAERGFDPGPADGLLGTQTIQAITAFQEDSGLPTTGRIDGGLVAALQESAS